MGKIGDLWVKLGLKGEEFNKGIKDAERQTENFGKSFAGLSVKAAAAWAAIGAAIGRFVKDAVRLTQTWGDRWDETVAGINGAYQSFVRTISSGEGWRNLFSNMREAYRTAKEVAAALDEVFERKVSFSYQEAETKRQIANLQLIMRDASKSDAERKKAAQEIIKLEKELGGVKRDIAQQEADEVRKNVKRQTGLAEEDLNLLIRKYNVNRNLIKQAREYNDQMRDAQRDARVVQNTSQYALTPDQSKLYYNNANAAAQNVQDLEANTSEEVKAVAALVKKYDKANDELILFLAKAEIAVINVDTEITNASMRANSLIGSLSRVGEGKGNTEETSPFADFDAAMKEGDAKLEEFRQITKEILKGLDEDIQQMSDEIQTDLDAMVEGMAESLETTKLARSLMEIEQVAQECAEGFKEAIVSGFADGIQELTDQLFGLEDMNAGAVIKSLLSPLADMAIMAGTIIMTTGEGIEALKAALEGFFGVGAIAAGAILVGIGAAAKSGLAALANAGASSHSVATSSSGASNNFGNSGIVESQEITVHVEGRIKGSDIILAGSRTQNAWSR